MEDEDKGLLIGTLDTTPHETRKEILPKLIIHTSEHSSARIILRFEHKSPAPPQSAPNSPKPAEPSTTSELIGIEDINMKNISLWNLCSPGAYSQQSDLEKELARIFNLTFDELQSAIQSPDGHHLYYLSFTYLGMHTYDVNMLVNIDIHCSDNKEWLALRDHLSQNNRVKFHLLFRYHNMEKSLDEALQAMPRLCLPQKIDGKKINSNIYAWSWIFDWWKNHSINPQHDQLLTIDQWPSDKKLYEVSFLDMAHFTTVVTYSAFQAYLEGAMKANAVDADVRLALIPGAKRDKMVMLINTKITGKCFGKGEMIRVSLTGAKDCPYGPYLGYITDDLLMTPKDHSTAVIWPGPPEKTDFNENVYGGTDDDGQGGNDEDEDGLDIRAEIPSDYVLDLTKHSIEKDIQNAVANLPPLEVSIKMINSDVTWSRQMSAMKLFWDILIQNGKKLHWPGPLQYRKGHAEEVSTMLRANRLMNHQHNSLLGLWNSADITQSVVDEMVAELCTKEHLYPAQQEILRMATSLKGLPSGVLLAKGGAGVGKTAAMLFVIIVVCMILQKYPTMKLRVLCTTDANVQTNEICNKLERLLGDINKPGVKRPVVITRGHAVDTEKALFEKKGRIPSKARPITETNPDATWEIIEKIKAALHEGRKPTIPGANDPRVEREDISIAARVLQVCGSLPIKGYEKDDNPFTPPDEERQKIAQSLAQMIVTKFEDVVLDVEAAKQLRNGYKVIQDYVLKELTDILVCPVNTALAAFFYTRYDAKILLVDEASRLSELQWAALAFRYQNALLRLFSGDENQLGPYNEVQSSRALFANSAGTSVFCRFMAAGYPTVQLIEQIRCHPKIMELLNHIAYKFQVTAPNNPTLDSPTDHKVAFAAKSLFKIKNRVLWLENDGEAEQAYITSRINKSNADVGLWLALALVTLYHIEGNEVLVIAPYTAQVDLYRQKWKQLLKTLEAKESFQHDILNHAAGCIEQLKLVRFRTWDEAEGSEATAVIADTVITHEVGFLYLKQRWVAALSRAKNLLCIIGNASSLEAFAYSRIKKTTNKDQLGDESDEETVVQRNPNARWRKGIVKKLIDWKKGRNNGLTLVDPSYRLSALIQNLEEMTGFTINENLQSTFLPIGVETELDDNQDDAPTPWEIAQKINTVELQTHGIATSNENTLVEESNDDDDHSSNNGISSTAAVHMVPVGKSATVESATVETN
jgi:hypothetical protein